MLFNIFNIQILHLKENQHYLLYIYLCVLYCQNHQTKLCEDIPTELNVVLAAFQTRTQICDLDNTRFESNFEPCHIFCVCLAVLNLSLQIKIN